MANIYHPKGSMCAVCVNKGTANSLADQGVIETVDTDGFYFTWTLTSEK